MLLPTITATAATNPPAPRYAFAGIRSIQKLVVFPLEMRLGAVGPTHRLRVHPVLPLLLLHTGGSAASEAAAIENVDFT